MYIKSPQRVEFVSPSHQTLLVTSAIHITSIFLTFFFLSFMYFIQYLATWKLRSLKLSRILILKSWVQEGVNTFHFQRNLKVTMKISDLLNRCKFPSVHSTEEQSGWQQVNSIVSDIRSRRPACLSPLIRNISPYLGTLAKERSTGCVSKWWT